MSGKPIRLGKVAGELNVGFTPIIEFLSSKGIQIDPNPNSKLTPQEFRLLSLEFLSSSGSTIQSASEQFGMSMTQLVEFLQSEGFGISKPYRPTDPLTTQEYEFLLATQKVVEPKMTLDNWLQSLGELEETGLGIGFSNFRRFPSFPMIQLGDITFLVGKNNSGKSTLVKAILLFKNYLQNSTGQRFTFAGEVLNDANIVTFDRAIFRNNTNGKIEFDMKLDNIIYSVNISGKEDSTDARVNILKFYDLKSRIYFEVDYSTRDIYFLKKASKVFEAFVSGDPGEVDWFMDQINSLRKELNALPNKLSREGLGIVDQINKLQNQLENLKISLPERKIEAEDIEYYASFREPMPEIYGLDDAIQDFKMMVDIEDQGLFGPSNDEIQEMEDGQKEKVQIQKQKVRTLKNDETISDVFDKSMLKFSQEEFFYLGANPTKQSALFLIRDKGNALAQAIHDYKQAEIPRGSLEDLFVKKWMEEFEIGNDYRIEINAGEAYEFYVIDESGEYHLSDKGMGSLQVMMLVLRLANLIYNSKDIQELGYRQTILVEEPELNLHPRLQSKLTELFHEVNTNHGFRFIIETHSTFMIRASQVIGLKKEYFTKDQLNVNPFKVYYFDDKDLPFEMRYTEEGRFNRNFGEGFYDEEGRLNLETIKLARK